MRRFPDSFVTYAFSEDDRERVERLTATLASRWESAEDNEFLADAHDLARELPRDLVRFAGQFRVTEHASAMAIVGLEVDGDLIGPTPSHWRDELRPHTALREEFYFVLLGSLLGDVFGWSTLQDGHLIHSVLPIAGEEAAQSGHGSDALLEWHTEDGFHPYRPDYLGLMCLRNPDSVATTYASPDNIHLTAKQRRVLTEPRFLIRPDKEHLRRRQLLLETGTSTSVLDIEEDPKPTAVLFGDPRQPYLRIDPTFMTTLPGDTEAEAALRVIVEQLDCAIEDVVLAPGDVCFIDNYRAVHGRRPFKARYDGTDRWLKKVIITRDLRKSRALRGDAESRVLV